MNQEAARSPGTAISIWSIPSAATCCAYGLRRTFAVSKFTSAISRNDARDGSRGVSTRATWRVAADDADPLSSRTAVSTSVGSAVQPAVGQWRAAIAAHERR